MRVTIYQPQYFPRLHYFNRILDADIFVILESAQYTKTLVHKTLKGRERHKSYQSDSPIKMSNGKYLLTVPAKHDGLQSINKTKLDYTHKWQVKHLANINANYNKAESFTTLYPELRELLTMKYETLAELNIKTILWAIVKLLDFTIPLENLSLDNVNKLLQTKSNIRLKKIMLDSQLDVQRPEGLHKGTEWTAEICQVLGATEYLHGGTAQTMYMDLNYYKDHGIKPLIQDWKCKKYQQQYAKTGFMANLSIIDLLMNVPSKRALSIIYEKSSYLKHPSLYATYPVFGLEMMFLILEILGKLPGGIKST